MYILCARRYVGAWECHCVSDIGPGVQCTYSVQGAMLRVGVLLCISYIKPGVQCTYILCAGDMLGVGVLLCISEFKTGVQCTYILCAGGYVEGGSVTVYMSLYNTIQQWDYKPAVPDKYDLHSYISFCVYCCVLGSVFEKADPALLSETFGLSAERLNGRTDVLNVTLQFLFVFIVC
jgi:hypothetical protein